MATDLPIALDRIAGYRAKSRAGTRPRGKVLGFLGSKGGCGATTLACHVGKELQRQTNLHVLLADFDIDSGIIGFLMKSQSRYTLSDALASAHRLDPSLWKALVSNGHKGIDVLMAPQVSVTRETPDPRSYRYIVPFARGTYDWTLLDMGRSLTSHTMEALSEADDTFLVTTSDIPALHQSKEIVQVLLGSGISPQHLHVILNRTPKRLDVSLEELDRMLGVPVYATVPDDYGPLHEAYSSGTLLPPNSNLSKHFARVAAKIAGFQQKAAKKGLFSF
jgi:pilus assembly protein CpaE